MDATEARVASQSNNPISPHAQAVSQATRRDRRVFLGNLPVGVGLTEKQITEFLTSLMRDRGMLKEGDEPIVSLWVHPERKYAFAELDSVEHANGLLSFSSATLLSNTVRIKKPDYRHETGQMDAIHGVVPGTIAASLPGSIAAFSGSSVSHLGAVGASAATAPATSAPAASSGACALRCSNMASPEDFASAAERESLKEEVGDECARFGEVESIKIPTSDNAECHLYVRFATAFAARTALQALQGRKFDGREVQIAVCPIERFEELVDGA